MSTSIGTASKMKRKVGPVRYEEEEKLPIGVIDLILLHLPIKTLSRFRCVCKSWSSLVSSPFFQRDHDRRCAGERPFLLLIQNCTPTIHLSTYSPNQTIPLNNFPTKIPGVPCWGPHPFSIQSCRGLLCLASRKNIFLCNPSTQEVMPLPPLPPTQGSVCFGFGYAASTQEFKVVKFCNGFVGFPILLDWRVTHCEVFTLGTTMWRKARRPPFAACCPVAPFVNGAIHLLPYIYGPNKAIAAFNLETENYNHICLPECYERNYGDLVSLWALESESLSELGGYLCLTLNFVTQVDLWILKDYDNGEWTKQYTIDTGKLVNFSSPGIYVTRAFLIMADGNILMNLTRQDQVSELVCYDPQGHTIKQIIGTDCSVTFYVESFFRLQ